VAFNNTLNIINACVYCKRDSSSYHVALIARPLPFSARIAVIGNGFAQKKIDALFNSPIIVNKILIVYPMM